jgi:ABC-type antimicrobial peptide transport system permease subunit
MAFVVRTASEPHAMIPTIRRAAAELDPALPLARTKTMDEHVAVSLARPKFISTLVTAFGILALTLAMIGIYGVMSWSVSERRREFAIRLALGMRRPALVGSVLSKALALAAAGIALGLAGAWTATGVLRGLLFGIQPTDPSTFASTAALITVIALAACYIPARRATAADPASLLR